MNRYISLALLVGLLSACDPMEIVYLERAGGEALLCPGGETTRCEVVYPVTDPDDRTRILYEERSRFILDPEGGPLSTDPDRVSAGLIAGSLESGRVPWIQFTVTCGEAGAPLVTTPKITREDLRKVDGEYFYVVE